jgi:cytochrome c oxidase subunit 2
MTPGLGFAWKTAAESGMPAQSVLHPAGPQAAHILSLWHFTLLVCGLVFAAVVAATLVALWRTPRSGELTPPDLSPLSKDEPALRRNVLLATALSIVLLFVLLAADVFTDRALARLPLGDGRTGALNIELVGHQWWWEAHYDDPEPDRTFTVANELHIPVGRPVIVTLKSGDVIHSLWVPNLHGKKDLIPGRTARVQFRADRPGSLLSRPVRGVLRTPARADGAVVRRRAARTV